MWLGMMTAMMFPTILPMVAAHRYVVRRRGEGIAPTVTFVAGYLLVWAVAGVVPLAVLLSFRGLRSRRGSRCGCRPWAGQF